MQLVPSRWAVVAAPSDQPDECAREVEPHQGDGEADGDEDGAFKRPEHGVALGGGDGNPRHWSTQRDLPRVQDERDEAGLLRHRELHVVAAPEIPGLNFPHE